MTVALVTDSTASLSGETATREDIIVVRLQVVIGADVYTEGEDVTAQMIAEALEAFVPVSTSRPTPQHFGEVYERAARGGATEVVSIHLSSKMSGTFDSALLAAKSAPIPVTCVDTRQVGIATGFAALRAAAARDAGGTVAAVAAAAREAGENSSTLFYVDTLEFLRRGGRVGSAAALIGSALAVKPLLTVRDGLITQLEKVRTSARAISRVEALAATTVAGYDSDFSIGVQHLANASVAETVAERLATSLEIEPIEVHEVGAAIGAHVGPGMISVTLTPH